MSDLLKVAIPALIALAGTIVAVTIGYRQWKRQQSIAKNATYLMDKQTAYRDLWDKVEAVHVKVRVEDVSRDTFNQLTRDINSFLLQKGLYFESEDKALVERYLNLLYKFREIVLASGDLDAEADMRVTGAQRPVTMARVKGLASISADVTTVRDAIIGRCRAVLKGDLA